MASRKGNDCSPGLVDVWRASVRIATRPSMVPLGSLGFSWVLVPGIVPAAGDTTVTTPKRFRAVVALARSTTFSAL
jgi:hypothetical protein